MEALTALLDKGGFVSPPLVLCALVLWYAIGYRALNLRRGTRRSLGDIVDRCRADERVSGVLGRAAMDGLAGRGRRGVQLAIETVDAGLGRGATVIAAVVTVAPLLGLLGTVSGMIETFDALGDMSLFSQSGGIAGGVSEALFSTQLGLAVAIPGLVAGRVLQRRQAARSAELAQLQTLILEAR